MQVSILTIPHSTSLLSLQQVKTELLVADSAQDDFLTTLMQEASESIYSYAGRPLYRAVWRELQEAQNDSRLLLSRYPVASLDAATFNGATQALSAINPAAGIYHTNTGPWGWSSNPQWSFDYCAGWFTTNDDIAGTINISGVDNSFNSSGLFECGPLMRAGDLIYVGESVAANNGFKTVASTPTTSKIIVREALSSQIASFVTIGVRNLPGWIERAAMKLLQMRYHARDRDPAMAELQVGGADFVFKVAEVEKSVRDEVFHKLALSMAV